MFLAHHRCSGNAEGTRELQCGDFRAHFCLSQEGALPVGVSGLALRKTGQGLIVRQTEKLRRKVAGRHGSLKGGSFSSPGRKAMKEMPGALWKCPVGLPLCQVPRKGRVTPWPAHIGFCHWEAVQGRTEPGGGEGDRGGMWPCVFDEMSRRTVWFARSPSPLGPMCAHSLLAWGLQ